MLKKISLLSTLSIVSLATSSLTLANTNLVISNDNNREALSITIYNKSLALINETRSIPLKAGLNNVELKGVSAQIRAETALLTSRSNSAFSIIEQNFDYDLLSPQVLLNKAVGKEIEIIKTHPTTGVETREPAMLLSNSGQPVLQFKDRIEIGSFNNFAFQSIPEGLRDRPTLSVLLNSDKTNHNNIQLTYLTGGFSWKADYTATLSPDEKLMDLSGLITLNNQSGTTFDNAKLQLIAGDINQIRDNFRNRELITEVRQINNAYKPKPIVEQESFGDYHLYKIPFATDLKNNQTKQVALLSTQNIPVEKEYRFNQNYSYTTADGENLKASVLYRVHNKKAHQLGMPLPKGIFRLYKNDSGNNALLLDEDSIQHIAENEAFAINTGDAFDVSLTKTLTEKITVAKNVHQYTYNVIFNNAKDEDITINYLSTVHYRNPNWDILKTSIPSSTKDANTAQWIVNIPAKEKVTLIYTLQVDAQ